MNVFDLKEERIEVLESALMDFKALIETLPTENIDARTSRLVTGALNAMYEHILDVMHERIIAQRVRAEEPRPEDEDTERIVVLPADRLDYVDEEELGR